MLVAEDFEVLARAIATGLRREGMAVDVALDGTPRWTTWRSPATTWWFWIAICRACTGTRSAVGWRQSSRQPGADVDRVSSVGDRVNGLGLGADDYLPKPFDFAELVARVRALGRRTAARCRPTSSAAT